MVSVGESRKGKEVRKGREQGTKDKGTTDKNFG